MIFSRSDAEDYLKSLFGSRRFHSFFQIATALLCAWWWFHTPAPGKAILALTIAAIFVTIEGIRGWQRALWLVFIFLLAFMENRAINTDRATFAREQAEARQKEHEAFQAIATGINTSITESENQFNTTLNTEKNNLAQTLGGLKETVKAATGGDGFCYALVIPPAYAGNAAGVASVIPKGKYPLTNVNAMVTDDDMVVEHLNEAGKHPEHSAEEFANIMQRAQEWVHIGDLPPNFPEQFSMRAALVPAQDRRMVTIFFYANNGSWIEKFALRKVNGQWLRLIRVWRERLDMKKKAMEADVIFEQIDPGFPEDTNTKPTTGLHASPSH